MFYSRSASLIRNSSKTKETFKEVFSDTINVDRDLAASYALRRNKNSDYLKMVDSIKNRNNITNRFNVARDNKKNCIICEKLGHVDENCNYLNKAQEVAFKKENPDFDMQNQQLSTNYQLLENNNNNSARNNYWNNHFLENRNYSYINNNFALNNYPDNNLLRNRNNNYNNFLSNRNNYPNSNRYYNYINNNFLRNRNYENRQENLYHNRYANYRPFLNQNRQREMGNQQLSRTNQKYARKSEVTSNYCKKLGHVIQNCNIK